MKEIGFWVYTGTRTGGCEGYGERQWSTLLDEMAAAGMNSIVICLNCKRQGFRSRLPYLQNDQNPDNPVIASNNELVHFAIAEAQQRGLKVWIQLILNCYVMDGFDIPLPSDACLPGYGAFKFDLDTPQIKERALERALEVIELFPQADGLCVELEGHSTMYAHRIEPYNSWAKDNARPAYEEVYTLAPNARLYPHEAIREYSTWQQLELLHAIEGEAASRSWRGEYSAIIGTGNQKGAYLLETDLEMWARQAANWTMVPYDYDRWRNRGASRDFCMSYPKSLGLETCFLGRGVMTWGHWEKDAPTFDLRQSWQRDLEDAVATGVDGLWFFEADAFTDGPHADSKVLRQYGFESGAKARHALLETVRQSQIS